MGGQFGKMALVSHYIGRAGPVKRSYKYINNKLINNNNRK